MRIYPFVRHALPDFRWRKLVVDTFGAFRGAGAVAETRAGLAAVLAQERAAQLEEADLSCAVLEVPVDVGFGDARGAALHLDRQVGRMAYALTVTSVAVSPAASPPPELTVTGVAVTGVIGERAARLGSA